MSSADTTLVGNLLDNDEDPDGDALAITNTGTMIGLYGVLVINADGSFTYTLDQSNPLVAILGPGETLVDFFDYEESDGRGGISSGQLVVLIIG